MKAKYTILIIIVGYSLDFIGGLFKITHRTNADTMLVIATIMKVTGVILFGYKIIQYEGFRKFMNK